MFSVGPKTVSLKVGIALVLIANMFFSIASAFVWSIQQRMPTAQIIFIQHVIGFCAVLPLLIRGGIGNLKTSFFSTHLVRDLFGVLSYFFFFLAIKYLNLVDATLLNYTAPFFVPFIWRIWYKEPIQTNVWWSIIIGFIGLAIILNPTKEIFAAGLFVGLFSGICTALAFIGLRSLSLKAEPVRRSLFYFFVLGSLVSFPFALHFWVTPSFFDLLLAISIGLLTAAGQVFLTRAYCHGPAAHLSPVGYSSIIYNGLIAFFAFGQQFGWHSFLGTSLIIGGGLLTYLFEKKPAQK